MGDAGGEEAVDEGFGLGAGGIVFLHLERRGAGDEDEVVGAAETFGGLGGVVAVLPCGIVLDGLHGHVAPHAVATGEFDGETGERSEGIGEARVSFAPDEGLHAAHRGAEDEAKVIDVETFEEHGVLAGDHVVVVVLGEFHAEAVGGFGGFAVADVVGEDEEVLGDVEGLAGAEEDVREDGIEEGVGAATGAVKQEDGVVGVALRVFVRMSEGELVEVKLFDGFAIFEMEVGDVVAAFLRGPWGGGVLGEGGDAGEKR